jgi:hypothetical protein
MSITSCKKGLLQVSNSSFCVVGTEVPLNKFVMTNKENGYKSNKGFSVTL